MAPGPKQSRKSRGDGRREGSRGSRDPLVRLPLGCQLRCPRRRQLLLAKGSPRAKKLLDRSLKSQRRDARPTRRLYLVRRIAEEPKLTNFTLRSIHSGIWILTKLDRARSRLYRSQILQENMRLKALAEIYTMHSFAQLCNLIFFKI